MKEFKLTIKTENEAFSDENGGAEFEVARILRDLADKFEDGKLPGSVRDINGNKVGEVTVR